MISTFFHVHFVVGRMGLAEAFNAGVDYRIAGYFREGKFSRMHDAVTFRGKIFADG